MCSLVTHNPGVVDCVRYLKGNTKEGIAKMEEIDWLPPTFEEWIVTSENSLDDSTLQQMLRDNILSLFNDKLPIYSTHRKPLAAMLFQNMTLDMVRKKFSGLGMSDSS